MEEEISSCAKCHLKLSERACREEDGKGPVFCPTLHGKEIVDRSLKEYANPEILEFARQASVQEGEAYGDRNSGYDHVRPVKPRIVEVMEFSEKMGFKRLGLAFCSGLRKEANVIDMLLGRWGFEVVSVICKAGRTPKEKIGIRDDQKIAIGHFESMCNPIMQALVLNDARTEFNILLGLCVGHDSLFLRYAEAPCTVLAVKDRLLGHNPLAAVYNIDSYYRSLKNQV